MTQTTEKDGQREKGNKSFQEGSLFSLDSDSKVKADGTSVWNSFHLKSWICVCSARCF